MKAVVQRVRNGAVSVAGDEIARTGAGLVVLLGIEKDDKAAASKSLAEKILEMRIFDDDRGKMNLSAIDVRAEVLVVSQFTLCADLNRGRRPVFNPAAAPIEAEELCGVFVEAVRSAGLVVREGKFGARMLVEIYNDGPVTFVVEG